MSTEWTTERLDALSENTLIEWTEGGPEDSPPMGLRTKGGWEVRYYGGDDVLSEEILAEADPGSIRVVSVPVEALLSGEAVQAAAGRRGITYREAARSGIRAAIAHVTGEES